MSQFIVVGDVPQLGLPRVGEWQDCLSLTDSSGGGERLVDELWSAQRNGEDLELTRLVGLLSRVVASGGWFLCWQGSDFVELQVAHTWAEVLAELRSQTLAQPADLFVRFLPRS